MMITDEYVKNRYRNSFGSDMHCVYLFESDGFYKLGRSDDADTRVGELQTGNPHEIKFVTSFTAPKNYCIAFEQAWHRRLSGYHQRGEWFYLTTDVLEILVSEMRVRQKLHDAIMCRIRGKARLTVWDILLVELDRPVRIP
jgi:hypothetical protein